MLKINSTEDEVKLNLEQDDFFNVILNNQLEVHIVRTETGYVIDTYKVSQSEDEDYDYDEDYIDSLTVWEDDLIDEDEEE